MIYYTQAIENGSHGYFAPPNPVARGFSVAAYACSANREPMLNVPAPVPSPAPAGFAEIFDAAAVAAELERLPALQSGNELELRTAVAQKLKAALTRGRAVVERMLLRDRRGRLCAERLCFMQDEIIRILFEFAQKHLYPAENPSEAERLAIVATGGYGRGILAPGSDIDLLFLLPYKQTAWSESIAEAI